MVKGAYTELKSKLDKHFKLTDLGVLEQQFMPRHNFLEMQQVISSLESKLS